MPFESPFSEEKRASRREMLKAFGIGVPAAAAFGTSAPVKIDGFEIRPSDVFQMYVADMVTSLPASMHDAACDPFSTLRALINAQAMASTNQFFLMRELMNRS